MPRTLLPIETPSADALPVGVLFPPPDETNDESPPSEPAPQPDSEPESDDEDAGPSSYDRRLLRAVLGRAEGARRDPARFFEFCLREEKTQARVTTVAHQRVLFSFVQAFPRCVIRMPAGSSKTFCMAALTLWLLGCDPTERGAIISASEGQAAKPFSMVQDYLEDEHRAYPEMHLTFPALRPSPRQKDKWTETRLVVDRPPGIRDASLSAIGIDGMLQGARLSWILVDDVLSEENTSTPAARQKINRLFFSKVLSRKDIERSRIVVTNTPWHPGDLTHALERAGWPTLTMSIEGDITVTNADEWDTDELRCDPRSRNPRNEGLRLSAHDSEDYGAPLCRKAKDGEIVRATEREIEAWRRGERADLFYFDLDGEVPLWPEKFPIEAIEELRDVTYASEPHVYNQMYRCRVRDDATAKCKVEWIERAKDRALALGHFSLVKEYRGGNVTVTGLDLALGEDERHDYTAFFTFEVIPVVQVPPFLDRPGKTLKNARRILDVEFGRFPGRVVVDKLIDKVRRYNSFVRVESNGGQDFLRQWVLDVDISIPVKAHTTGKNKTQRVIGVEGLFIELESGAWIIPCDPETRAVHPAVRRWIDECLEYQPPPAHTGDVLMASWLGRAQARALGAFDGERGGGGSVAASLAAR
jgi:hypothetical protein